MAVDRAMARRASGVIEMPDRRGVGRKVMSDFEPGQEFAKAKLGDRRRTARVVRVTEQIAKEAQRSLPKLMSSGDLEGAYRILSNEEVDHRALLAAHAERVTERSAAVSQVLVIHDTTELSFPLRGGQLLPLTLIDAEPIHLIDPGLFILPPGGHLIHQTAGHSPG
jgi:hypothetical protein